LFFRFLEMKFLAHLDAALMKLMFLRFASRNVAAGFLSFLPFISSVCFSLQLLFFGVYGPLFLKYLTKFDSSLAFFFHNLSHSFISLFRFYFPDCRHTHLVNASCDAVPRWPAFWPKFSLFPGPTPHGLSWPSKPLISYRNLQTPVDFF